MEEKDTVLAGKVEPLEEVIDELNQEVKKRHAASERGKKCTIEMGFILSDIITDLERVADHCSNIANLYSSGAGGFFRYAQLSGAGKIPEQ